MIRQSDVDFFYSNMDRIEVSVNSFCQDKGFDVETVQYGICSEYGFHFICKATDDKWFKTYFIRGLYDSEIKILPRFSWEMA